jgi:hypothetical protein
MMRKLIYLIVVLSLAENTYSQLKSPLVINKKLSVGINKNVELLGFGYFLAFEGANIETQMVKVGDKEMPEKDWQQFGYHFYQQYKSYASSSNLISALTVADHLWLDYIIALLLQTDDFPGARLKPEIDEVYYLRFSKTGNRDEAVKNVKVFLDGLNEFYKEVNFDHFLTESAERYNNAIDQVKAALPSVSFIDSTEAFYRQYFDQYRLVPSLTIPKGMGFGPGITINGRKIIFSVFGAFTPQQFKNQQLLDMGFADPVRLRELSVHEFGHSFVNPAVYAVADSIITAKEVLFEPVKAAMGTQGYNTWRVCLIEHFVRAGEVLIAEKYAGAAAAEKLKQEYIDKRKFIYLPEILTALRRYDHYPAAGYTHVVENTIRELKLVNR